jgi:hypothetical protein
LVDVDRKTRAQYSVGMIGYFRESSLRPLLGDVATKSGYMGSCPTSCLPAEGRARIGRSPEEMVRHSQVTGLCSVPGTAAREGRTAARAM